MMEPYVETCGGLTLDLSQIKCFKQERFYPQQNYKHRMIVVFKTRYDYIKHPGTNKYIKQKYDETVEYEFPDYATAKAHVSDWQKLWEKYLLTRIP